MKNILRSIIPSCSKGVVKSEGKPKKQVSNQSSFTRFAMLDLSYPSSMLSEDLSTSLAGSNLHVFTLGELKLITQSFSSANFLGQGGFGKVHKGFIDDKLRPGLKAQPVAVKNLDLEGLQGHREWLDYNAKLSDFGLAKDGPEGDDTHVSTRVMGTEGYAAPEYVMTGHLTAMSDVYSFGVVLLELLTGRRSLDKNRSPREQNLVEWARPMLNDHRKLGRIMDPRLEGQYSEMGARKAAALACQCLSQRPKQRPKMCDVVQTLEPLQDYEDIPIGHFVYTAPAESEQKKELKKDNGNHQRNHKLHQGHRHQNRSPMMSPIHSKNGQNSP
ncbi:hypothetical protein V6N13_025924 [Hibiscus sabdariffa]